jgi:hypothetical protein
MGRKCEVDDFIIYRIGLEGNYGKRKSKKMYKMKEKNTKMLSNYNFLLSLQLEIIEFCWLSLFYYCLYRKEKSKVDK